MQNNFIDDNEYKNSHIIISRTATTGDLILGDFNSAVDQQMLRENNVKTIITSAKGFQHLKIPSEYTHVVFPIADIKSQNIRAYFDESNKIIEESLKRGGVLVHCGSGVSRSATLIIAYYMKKNKETFRNAITFVRNIRSIICPNLGFQLQLKKYETELGFGSPVLQKKPRSNMDPDSRGQIGYANYNHNHHQSTHLSQNKGESKRVFNFEPSFKSVSSYKKSEKRVAPRQYPKSKPKEQTTNNFKKLYEVVETKLYITGKGTSKQNQRIGELNNIEFNNVGYKNGSSMAKRSKQRNPLLGTWGPAAHKAYKLQM